MGWWDAGEGDDTIGDGPADRLHDAFKEVSAHYDERGGPRPTLPELLDIVTAALKREPEAIVEEGKGLALGGVEAELEGTPGRVSGTGRPPADDFAARALFDAFEDIAAEYEETEMERKPRVSELLATLTFILRPKPGRYLSDAEAVSLKKLVARDA